MKTVRRPPYPKWNPGYFPCSSLTPLPLSSRRPSVSFGGFGLRGPVRRLKTVRRPPIYPKTPGHLPCSSLTHPLPLSSRRPSVSFGGFGLSCSSSWAASTWPLARSRKCSRVSPITSEVTSSLLSEKSPSLFQSMFTSPLSLGHGRAPRCARRGWGLGTGGWGEDRRGALESDASSGIFGDEAFDLLGESAELSLVVQEDGAAVEIHVYVQAGLG